MIKKIIKENYITLIKFQLNSILSVTLRSLCIFVFTDIMTINYSVIFWTSLIIVSFNSYVIQKKFVFKRSKKDSFKKYIVVSFSLALFEYLTSILLKTYFEFNVYAFLVAGFFTFIIRFLMNKNIVFN